MDIRKPYQIFTVLLMSCWLAACSLLPASSVSSPGGPARPGEHDDRPVLIGLAIVDRIEVRLLESFPVQASVFASGSLPDGCTELAEPIQALAGSNFRVVLQTTRPAGALCTEELREYEIEFPLDVAGLPAGTYMIEVNGVGAAFDLVQDNATSAPKAELSGLVWHDLCAIAGGEGGAPLVPSAGCLPFENSFRANGILETGEPGLAGVRVKLGSGACPSTGLAEDVTTQSGQFSFSGLEPGEYCVSVDPLDPQNQPLLIPGDWSEPEEARHHAIAGIPLTLAAGEERSDIRFGWDFQFLPAAPVVPTPTPAATPTPTPVPTPCNWAKFIADVTVPDYTPYSPGTGFTKTWRLQNAGTCTWTSGYDLVFVTGNAMSDVTAFALPAAVRPGETIDLSVKMTAPNIVGNHKGSWMLRSESGALFGLGNAADQPFWVLIKVLSPNTDFVYDFAANYCLAEWRSEAGVQICPGNTGGSKGFVALLDHPIMENRTDDEPALWMRPNHDPEGWLAGEFPPVIVQEGDRFQAWIGCLAESNGCDVSFRLLYRADGGGLKELGEWRETFDGEVTWIDIDLTFLARRSVEFTLAVEINNKKYESADAFWFVPRIVNPESGPGESDVQSPAVQAARSMVAAALGIAAVDLDVKAVQGPVVWKDSCLEVEIPGFTCIPASVSGYRVILEHDGKLYEAHTNTSGSIVYWFYSG